MEQFAVEQPRSHHSIEVPPMRGATVEYIVEHLRGDVLTRRLHPGEHLVENDLTVRFAVSRGPVREALRRLAAEGLIDHFPHRGAWVKQLSRIEMRELLQIGVELESLGAQLAGAITEPRSREAFETAIQPTFEERERHEDEFMLENNLFHEAVLTLSGNGQLQEFSRRLHLPLLMSRSSAALSDGALLDAVREHRVIATAILAGDSAAAGAAMRAHLQRAAALAAPLD